MTITHNIQFGITDGSWFRQTLNHNVQYDTTGTDGVLHSQTIPHTAWTALDFGNITGTPEAFCVINNDATNYVEFAVANDDSGVFATLDANRSMVISPKSGVTYYARANTAGVQILIAAAEASA